MQAWFIDSDICLPLINILFGSKIFFFFVAIWSTSFFRWGKCASLWRIKTDLHHNEYHKKCFKNDEIWWQNWCKDHVIMHCLQNVFFHASYEWFCVLWAHQQTLSLSCSLIASKVHILTDDWSSHLVLILMTS